MTVSPEERKARCEERAKRCKEALAKLGSSCSHSEHLMTPSKTFWNMQSSLIGSQKRFVAVKLRERSARSPGSLEYLSTVFKDFGLHHGDGGRWTYREWVPNAKEVYLFGDFNGWNRTGTPLAKAKDNAEIWCCQIGTPLNAALTKGSQYRLYIVPNEGEATEMIPPWAIRYAINSKTKSQNAVVWPTSISRGPSRKDLHQKLELKGKRLHLYEFDITLVAQKGQKPSLKFARSLLQRAAHSGYHGVLLKGLHNAEARFSAGSLMTVSPTLGDPPDFLAFLQKAHDLGLAVILDLASGADPSLSSLPRWYFQAENTRAAVRSFDFARKEVAQHLLYSIKQLDQL